MATLGPVVVVAERSAADLVEALGKAGAFPIIETGFADAAAAIAEIQPAALILTDAGPWPERQAGASLRKAIETGGGPFMPVLARVGHDSEPAAPHALPIGADEPAAQAGCAPALGAARARAARDRASTRAPRPSMTKSARCRPRCSIRQRSCAWGAAAPIRLSPPRSANASA